MRRPGSRERGSDWCGSNTQGFPRNALYNYVARNENNFLYYHMSTNFQKRNDVTWASVGTLLFITPLRWLIARALKSIEQTMMMRAKATGGRRAVWSITLGPGLGITGMLLLLTPPLFAGGQGALTEPPNILLIVTDDQGYGDLSIHGNTVLETPNLDRLAGESVRLDQFHTAPVCAPTRASLLTGRNHHEAGVWDVHLARDYMRLDETTLAEVLRDAGYDTGMIGKWHSGRAGAWLPWNRGFNEAWVSELYHHNDTRISHNGKFMPTSGHADKCLTDIAMDFIRRDRGRKPFFLFMAYMSPHSPWVAPEAYVEKYRGKGCSDHFALLNGMIDHLDFQIGRLLTGLDDAGLAEDTLVVFMSDNGPNRTNEQRGALTDEEMAIRNAPGMRGQKGNIWENGHRVPCFVRWPGRFKPGTIAALADVTDIFPTLLDAAQVDTPDSGHPIHGRSLLRLLGGGGTDWDEPRDLFKPYWAPFKDESWVRDGATDLSEIEYDNQINAWYRGPYKLVQFRNKGHELYDLSEDASEKNDIATARPELTQSMSEAMRQAYRDMRATGRVFGQPRFHIGHPEYDAYETVGEVLAGSYIPFCSSVRDEGNVVCHTHNSRGWRAPGDAQTILVEVVTPGTYDVFLEAAGFVGGTTVLLQVGSSKMEAVLPEGSGEINLGQIELQTGAQDLRLSIVAVPEGAGDVIETMKRAMFKRRCR